MRNPRYPGADWAPLAGYTNRRMANPGHRLFTGHTMVWNFASCEAYFRDNGYNGVHSHMILRADGFMRQLNSLDRAAGADLNGNSYTISVEVEDKGPAFPAWSGSNVPPMTSDMVESLKDFCRWLVIEDWVPARIARNSCERGFGYHRLGIDPYRNPNCPKFSNAYAKACPGDKRIAQYDNQIFPYAISGSAPVEKDWFDMADEAMLRRVVSQELDERLPRVLAHLGFGSQNAYITPSKPEWEFITNPEYTTPSDLRDAVHALSPQEQMELVNAIKVNLAPNGVLTPEIERIVREVVVDVLATQ